jgi:hypothetical protein
MIAQVDRDYARYGYGRLARRLASYAFFEGRPHTTRGQWFNPVVFALLRSLVSIPGNPNVQRPIFLTGLGRSGTTILGTLLSLHRDVGFLNEPKAIWSLIDPRTDINGDYVADGGVFRLDAADVTAQTRERAHRLFARYLALTGAQRLLDKYPELIFRVGYLLELFPDARIIFITRNGLDTCQSIVQWSQHNGVKVGDRIDDWWGRGDIKWRYLCEQLIDLDPAYKTVRRLPLAELDHVNRGALEWIITMREGVAQETRHPGAVMRIAYERLVESPRDELGKLMEACGLPLDPAVTDYAARNLYRTVPKPYPRLVPPVARLFETTMDLVGYGSIPRDVRGQWKKSNSES